MPFFSLPPHIKAAMLRRKPLEPSAESELHRSLTAVDLILYGVGCSVGAGIYALIGIGANLAGPAITVSFLACGLACVFTSLAYAEFAARIPVTGSAFVYAYCTFGEFVGWLIGWNLTLGYGFTASVTARSWAEYLAALIVGMVEKYDGDANANALKFLTKLPLPFTDLTCSPLSIVVVALCTVILMGGAKDSSRFNNFMTVLNISVLLFVVLAGLFTDSVDLDNLTPFAPHGIHGIAQGAGLVFFAFIGFDMVACLSEEVVDPERNMPLGIVGSLVISAALYILVSGVVIGMAPIQLLGGDVPITNALLANACCTHEQQLASDAVQVCLSTSCSPVMYRILAFGSRFVSIGAIFALTSATFVGMMGQPRIFYSMAQDGLLFPIFAKVDSITMVPTQGILITGVIVATLACFVDLEALANMISFGTLMVFTFVDAAVIILRLRPWQRPVNIPSPSNRAFVLQTPTRSLPRPSLVPRSPRIDALGYAGRWVKSSRGNHVQDNGSKPTWLVLLFTMSMLVASACARADWGGTIPLGCGIMAIFSTIGLLVLPQSEPPGTFQCPFVPIFPLMGIAANCYMMGALPAQSLLYTLLWVMIGVAIYFSYGMEHSILGREEEKGLISKQRLAEDEMTSLNHQAKSTKSYDAMTLLPPSRVTTA
jgi:APA family basic amino acid/polyamine antiporter